MSSNRPVTRFAIGLCLSIFIFGWTHLGFAGGFTPETAAVTHSARPAVEAMFVLDTTSSMTGLIAVAKDKIWSIANTLASADPAPDIRMGLVGYRDRGDAYVTVFTPLSDDIDAVVAQLMQFDAVGGGDTPESVNQALYEAVTKPDWSSSPTVYRVIFLVGDAPPKMNYPDDVKYVQSCARAAQSDIVINTVQCGNMSETALIWREIAQLGRGETFQVAPSGDAVLYDTPFDETIARLSRALDDTRIYYGDADHLREVAARRKTADEIYSEARPSVMAKRTIFNSHAAGARNFIGSQELVHAVEAGELDLGEIPRSDLPAELKGLSEPALAALIENRSRERKQLQSEIQNLSKKRQRFLVDKVNNQKDRGAGSLDTKIYRCLQAQAAQKGIDYTDGPVY
jgi:hypothetical protein